MRLLWVAPWGRPLARVYAQALRALGAEVLVVTSAQHYEHAATTVSTSGLASPFRRSRFLIT